MKHCRIRMAIPLINAEIMAEQWKYEASSSTIVLSCHIIHISLGDIMHISMSRYSPQFLDAYIKVCCSVRFKYLYKYIYKGSDHVTVILEAHGILGNQQNNCNRREGDEILKYLDA